MKKYFTPLIMLSLFTTLFPLSTFPSTVEAQSNNYCADFYGNHLTTLNRDSRFNAHGFTRIDKTFDEFFGTIVSAPRTIKVLLPGPALRGPGQQYVAISFTMTGDQLGELGVQRSFTTIPYTGYGAGVENEEPGSVGTSISYSFSPCPGDFRPSERGSADPYLSHTCRGFGEFLNGGFASVAGLSGCPTPKGKKMYLNVANFHMFDRDVLLAYNPCLVICGVYFKF